MGEITLSSRLDSVSESATLALNARVKQLASEGKTIHNLTAGELAGDTPSYIQEYVSKHLALNKYTPVAGMAELREKLADHARNFYGLDWINRDNVIITSGAKPALYGALLALINPGDEVIVPTPEWVSYNHLIELAGGKVIEVPLTSSYDIDSNLVEQKLSSKTKAIILNSPHNPTGAVFSESSLKELATVLNDKDIMVISDDIYSKLVYSDNFFMVPSADFKNLLIVNGFSKSQAITGWRIGYAIGDTKVIKGMTSLISHIMGNASVPAQLAAIAALEHDDQPPKETIDTLKKQRKIVCDELNKIPEIKYHPPEGAFYVFLDLRQITSSSIEWCENLLNETGVALVPGEAFEAPGFARLTFVCEEETLKKALQLLSDFIKKGSK